jgi:small-conductance mechanosensitive channel
MEKRRVVFTLGVTYQTSAEDLAAIPNLVKQIITTDEQITYDRGHLVSFGDFSINYEFVYFIPSPDFTIFKDAHQRIYLTIYKEFEKRKIEFAYPTQTLFVNQQQDDTCIKN